MIEGGLLGISGAILGIAGGYALAAAALSLFGGDLGGGYFPGVRPVLVFDPLAAAIFFIAGTGVALLGSLSPALEAARARPAAALKAGSEDIALAPLALPWPGLVAVVTGGVFTQLPPVQGLPLFGYLAIALLLVGSIALMPRAAALLFTVLAKRWHGLTGSLSLARLANAPNQAAIALGGVLASFSLMVAMAIMVSSFRDSVDDWLQHLLSADLYVRVQNGGEHARFGAIEQQQITQLPSVARAEGTRHQLITLDPARPAVALIARSIDANAPDHSFTIVGDSIKGLERPVWGSEAMVDLYGWTPGQRVRLPIAGRLESFTVAGIWRDYARQSGAIMMRIEDYRQLSGDVNVNDFALWIKRDASLQSLRKQLDALPFAATLEYAEPGEIRAVSLKIFDRSFAVTYVLEGVAMVIGLFGFRKWMLIGPAP